MGLTGGVGTAAALASCSSPSCGSWVPALLDECNKGLSFTGNPELPLLDDGVPVALCE